MMIRRTVVSAIATLLAAASLTLSAYAQSSTAFTYQGFLRDNGQPANGTYDLQFTLYDALSGGNQIGIIVTVEDVNVADGLFTVEVDFGTLPFNTGAQRWIEIGVRPGDSTGGYSLLTPRIELTPVPYALYAQKAKDAENALSIQNRPVSNAAPAGGQVLKWNGSAWAPGNELWLPGGAGIYCPNQNVGIGVAAQGGIGLWVRNPEWYGLVLEKTRPSPDQWVRIGFRNNLDSWGMQGWDISCYSEVIDRGWAQFNIWHHDGERGRDMLRIGKFGNFALGPNTGLETGITLRVGPSDYSGKATAKIHASNWAIYYDWPSDWWGGLETFDIVCASIKSWGITHRSDERYKQNIITLDRMRDSERLLSLRPVSYELKPDVMGPKGTHFGFIAQEVQQVFPELVTSSGEENYLSVNYVELIPHLVNVLQKQQAEIDELRAEIQRLRGTAPTPDAQR
jgi:hypothetical protein